jgi:hypothetical protein
MIEKEYVMTTLDRVLKQAEPRGHYVQFYKADEPLLNRNVGQYLWEGLLRGDGLLVIASRQREESLTGNLRRLGVDVATAQRERQLLILNAEETMARFIVDGEPDPSLFDETIGEALHLVKPRGPDAGVRAYGEMVGVLWEAGQYEGAIRLEEYWNKILEASGITLFCGYPIDVFGKDLDSSNFQALLCAHTHHLPGGAEGEVHRAVHQAMEDVLGDQAEGLRRAIAAHASDVHERMPAAEATILWLRKNLPERAEGILSCARNYYREATSSASQAAA